MYALVFPGTGEYQRRGSSKDDRLREQCFQTKHYKRGWGNVWRSQFFFKICGNVKDFAWAEARWGVLLLPGNLLFRNGGDVKSIFLALGWEGWVWGCEWGWAHGKTTLHFLDTAERSCAGDGDDISVLSCKFKWSVALRRGEDALRTQAALALPLAPRTGACPLPRCWLPWGAGRMNPVQRKSGQRNCHTALMRCPGHPRRARAARSSREGKTRRGRAGGSGRAPDGCRDSRGVG